MIMRRLLVAVLGGLPRRAGALRFEAVSVAEMSDRMLADIGLTRADLGGSAPSPAWSSPARPGPVGPLTADAGTQGLRAAVRALIRLRATEREPA